MSDREQSGGRGESPEEVLPAPTDPPPATESEAKVESKPKLESEPTVEPLPKVEPDSNLEPVQIEPVPDTAAAADPEPEIETDTPPAHDDALLPVTPPVPPADPPPPVPSASAAPPPPNETPAGAEEEHDRPRRTVGIILIALGAWFFLEQFFDFWNWGELWPVLLILLGLILLFRR